MSSFWFHRIDARDIYLGKAAMLTNMSAGDTLAISKWRYSIAGSIAYTILRALIYCIRHFKKIDLYPVDINQPTYIYFTPSCENALRNLQNLYPGNIIGFQGKSCYNFPLWRMLAATIFCFRSKDILQTIINDRRWRPWISDIIFYILTKRWAHLRFQSELSHVLVYSNDHCCFDRGIVDAAADAGHVSVYVQHAAVSSIFPPLSASYSLLDGEHALKIYTEIEGGRGTALVCGRQYEIAAIRKRRQLTAGMLICTSTIDTVDSWRPIIAALVGAEFAVYLRTHPSDRNLQSWKRMAADVGALWLDPRDVGLADALEMASAVFAGQSGVLLEAALSGAAAVLVQFPEDTDRGLYDYFGFAAVGLAYQVTPENIHHAIETMKAGENFISNSVIQYFDYCYLSAENMRNKAIEMIISQNTSEQDFYSAGFALLPDHIASDLQVYVPADLLSKDTTKECAKR